jgi:inward rectifier potassium channel
MKSRTLTRDGRVNVVALGRRSSLVGDLNHLLLTTSWPRFIGAVVLVFVFLNLVFASLYVLTGAIIANARPSSFADSFYFSVQTLATIGYGAMAPANTMAHLLVSVEALTGLLGFAVITGLVFSKFSRPRARVMFSRVAVVAPSFEGTPALMFRVANERSNYVVEATLHLTLARTVKAPNGETFRRIIDLELVRPRTALFNMSWTVIHKMGPGSPLHGVTPEKMAEEEHEIFASFTGLDETTMQTIHARWSYVPSEIIWNARLADILGIAPDGRRQVDYTRFHDVAKG